MSGGGAKTLQMMTPVRIYAASGSSFHGAPQRMHHGISTVSKRWQQVAKAAWPPCIAVGLPLSPATKA